MTRDGSPHRGQIPPSELLDYQADDEPSSTTRKSAKEHQEDESFERFIQSNLQSRRKDT